MLAYGRRSKRRAEYKFWAKAEERGDIKFVVHRPEEHARQVARDDIEEKLAPGYKAWKKKKEHVEMLNIEIQLREKYANEEKDALERQLRASREAAGRRLTLAVAPDSDEGLCGAPGSNEYGQVAPQTYRYNRECPIHSENGTERFEFPREVPNTSQNQAGRAMHHRYYNPSQPYGIPHGQGHPDGHYEGSGSYADTTFSSNHELEGDMPAAHLSTVTSGGPYELAGQQYLQGYEHSGASSSGDWI